MNVVEATDAYFRKAAKLLDLSEAVVGLLASPLREIKVQVPITLDSGEMRSFTGVRVQHDNARGPMKGGLRLHPSVNLDSARALAALMTWKAAPATPRP